MQLQERDLLLDELDRKISPVHLSIFPICSSKLEKHEIAAMLLNDLVKKKFKLKAATSNVNVENDDSGCVSMFIT